MIVDKLHARYSTPHGRLYLQSKFDSLNLDDFMARHQIQMRKNVYAIWLNTSDKIRPQLVDGFHTESNKMRYFQNAVLG